MANDDNTMQKSSQSSTVWKARHVLAVFGLFGVGFIDMGVMKSFGVLVDDLAINFQSDIGTIGLVIGAYHGITYFLAPFVTPLLKYLSIGNVAAIAMGSAGCLCASSFSSSLAFFSVAIILSGASYSFVILAALNNFYELVPSEGADIAYGFADSGKAIGMVCVPIITEYFKEIYGWRGAILLLAGIGSHLSICTILMRGPPSDIGAVEKMPKSNYEEEQTSNDLEPLLLHSSGMESKMRASVKDKDACPTIPRFISDALGLRLLIKKPALISIYLFYLISGAVSTSWVVFLIPHGVSKGYPLSKAVYLASFGGIGNVIGRIAQGPIIHKRWLTSLDLIIILCIINAIIFLVDPLVSSFAVLGVNAFIGGLTLGARIALYVVLVKQFIPSDQFSTAIGFTCFFDSIGEPLGGLIAGWLSDVLGFGMAFMAVGAIELGVCLLLIPSRYLLTREDDHEE